MGSKAPLHQRPEGAAQGFQGAGCHWQALFVKPVALQTGSLPPFGRYGSSSIVICIVRHVHLTAAKENEGNVRRGRLY